MNYNDMNKILEKRSKGELLNLIKNLLQFNPSLISTIEFYLSNTESNDRIDLEPIKRKILGAVYGDLDYYHIDGALEILYEVRKHAETLYKISKFESAAEIYFLLVEGCIDAYDEGTDDSSGNLGDFGEECVLDFNKCVMEVRDDEFKTNFINRVLELYFKDDYGFNVELMFKSIVTKDNIKLIEEEFKDYMEITDGNYRSDYRRNNVKKTLMSLYKSIEMPEKSLQIALTGMRTAEDYKIAAETYMELGKLKEALESITIGLNLNGSYKPYDIFFKIIESIISAGQGEIININEMVLHGASYISSFSSWNFEEQKYNWVSNLFSRLNARDRFRETLLEKLKGEILIKILLEENEILSAVEIFYKLEKKIPNLALSIAYKAKKEGLIDISQKMTILAIKSGLTYFNEKDDHFIRESLDYSSIEILTESIPDNLDKKVNLLLAEVVSVKAPHLIKKVIKSAEEYEGKELLSICNNLVEKSPQDALQLCEGWILTFVERSHVYYNDVISMLEIIKRVLNQRKEAWADYLSKFVSKYNSRKKLIKMIQDAKLA